MTQPTHQTPAQRLGYNVGDQFVIRSSITDLGWTTHRCTLQVGDVVVLCQDDGTLVPLFEADGVEYPIALHLGLVAPKLSPIVVSMNRQYHTVSGLHVRILCIDRKGPNPVVGIVRGEDGVEFVHHWELNGVKSVPGSDPRLSLVEYNPFGDLKIDEPVLVRNLNDEDWRRRHFAGVVPNNRVRTYPEGQTRWSYDPDWGPLAEWLQCRRPTSEELAAQLSGV